MKKANTEDFYTKTNFHVEAFCSSRFSDKNENLLSRLQISFATAINNSKWLPDYVVVVLDNDLIDYIGFKNCGATTFYGKCLEWIFESFNKLIIRKNELLLARAQNINQTQIYWVAAVQHQLFEDIDKHAREKFNVCLEMVAKLYDNNTRVIKIRNGWNNKSSDMITYNRLSAQGVNTYWKAIDKSVQFNIEKRLEFLARENYRQLLKRKDIKSINDDARSDVSRGNHNGDAKMKKFFQRNRSVDRYHWHQNSRKLPKVD